MEHRVNHDSFPSFFMLIEDRVWKPAHQRSAIGFVGNWIQPWIPANRKNASIDTAEEFFAQPRLLFLVPSVGFVNVLLGFRQKDEISGHAGRECGVSHRSTKNPNLDSSNISVSVAATRPSATPCREPIQARQRCCPRGPPRVGP